YVDTAGKNAAKIKEYIKHQLDEDKMGDQLKIPFKDDPFTGSK
ncbi:MAG: IS200/IS605 family transposase, partial [Christensenella minuta]|nr:IS200/IS605 family transposase [Christensenella minuta]